MDNLPNNPSDPNNNNPNQPPPPFGLNFNPHVNPPDPNNPYASQPPQQPIPTTPTTPTVPENPDSLKHEHYSEAAQNKPRDEHGHFIRTNPDPQTPVQSGQTPPISPTPPPTPNPSNHAPNGAWLPPIIEINQNTKPTEKEDPPLFGFFLTNPVTYLKKFLSKLLKRQMITMMDPGICAVTLD